MNTEGTRANYKFFLREKSSLQSRVIPKPRKLLVLLGDKVAPGLPNTHAGLLLNLIIKPCFYRKDRGCPMSGS